MALERAPGLDRELSVTQWPGFPKHVWEARLAEARAMPPALPSLCLHARDRDAGAIRAATANAQRAGVDALIDPLEAPAPSPGPPPDAPSFRTGLSDADLGLSAAERSEFE